MARTRDPRADLPTIPDGHPACGHPGGSRVASSIANLGASLDARPTVPCPASGPAMSRIATRAWPSLAPCPRATHNRPCLAPRPCKALPRARARHALPRTRARCALPRARAQPALGHALCHAHERQCLAPCPRVSRARPCCDPRVRESGMARTRDKRAGQATTPAGHPFCGHPGGSKVASSIANLEGSLDARPTMPCPASGLAMPRVRHVPSLAMPRALCRAHAWPCLAPCPRVTSARTCRDPCVRETRMARTRDPRADLPTIPAGHPACGHPGGSRVTSSIANLGGQAWTRVRTCHVPHRDPSLAEPCTVPARDPQPAVPCPATAQGIAPCPRAPCLAPHPCTMCLATCPRATSARPCIVPRPRTAMPCPVPSRVPRKAML